MYKCNVNDSKKKIYKMIQKIKKKKIQKKSQDIVILQTMTVILTSFTPRTMARIVALRGPSTVLPSSVGPQEAL